jgi:argininosuccinate lyase
MYREDIQVSIAHAVMLGKCGIIPQHDSEAIVNELEQIRLDIESGKLRFDRNEEDIHMFIEARLTQRIGEAGKKLHTARSRNDQVATTLRLYLLKENKAIVKLIKKLNETLCKLAENHGNTIMPGYTHLQRARSVTFAHHLEAYVQMFSRDIERLRNAKDLMIRVCPLGACALAGTGFMIDREMTANLLGFHYPCINTIDAVSDRDFCIEHVGALSILMMHLSRFAEEIILWCSWEFGFIELHDDYCTGSSIMPQKRNPDTAELIRGKTGRVFGDLQALLVMMKGLPLAYNKDMQEDKEAVFDAVDTVKMCLHVFEPMISAIKVNTGNMRKAVTEGFLEATDCADYLTKKGVPFRDAYHLTKEIVAYCAENNTDFIRLTLDEYKKFSSLFENDIYEVIHL